CRRNVDRPLAVRRSQGRGAGSRQRITRARRSETRFEAAIGPRERAATKDENEGIRRTITASQWTGPIWRSLPQPVENKAAEERSKRSATALCEAYKGNVPEFPDLYKKRSTPSVR